MTNVLDAGFETGPNGAVISTTNSVFTSLVEAGWTFVNTPLVPSASGSFAGRCVALGTNSVIAQAPLVETPIAYARFYLYVQAYPAANAGIAQFKTTDALTARAELQLSPTGQIRMRNAAFSLLAASPADSAPLNGWCRIEWRFDNTALKQQLRVFNGANLHSATPTYDSGEITIAATGPTGRFAIGSMNGTAVMQTVWDHLKVDNATWVGSAVATSGSAPIANAGPNQSNIAADAQFTISGLASTDADGTISSYLWEDITGGASATVPGSGPDRTLTAPSNSTPTTRTYRLTVTDNSGLVSTPDTMTVSILAVPGAPSTYIFDEDFEGGANGAAFTTTNTDFAFVQAGWSFSSTPILSPSGGARVGKCICTGAASVVNGARFTAIPAAYSRVYLYLENYPAANATIAQYLGTAVARGEIQVGAGGTIRIRNSTFAAIVTAPAGTIPTGSWCRIEWRYDNAAARQQLRVFSGQNLHGSNPNYDSGSIVTTAAGTVDELDVGCLTGAAVMTANWDNLAVDNQWVGSSAPTVNQPPVANPGLDIVANPNLSKTFQITGSGSDPDGTISSYIWEDVTSGAPVAVPGTGPTRTISIPLAIADSNRVYRLTVVDNNDASSVAATKNVLVKAYGRWQRTSTGLIAVSRKFTNPTGTPVTPEPPVVTAATYIGACPDASSGQSVNSVITKYGTKAAVRQFVPGAFGGAVSKPTGTSRMHTSWKPSSWTDSQLITAFQNMDDGDMVEVWHEHDVKLRKNDDLPEFNRQMGLKNKFHTDVVRLRNAGSIPMVRTVCTLGGWTIDNSAGNNFTGANPDGNNTGTCLSAADYLGVDMDGIEEKPNFYDYATVQMGTKFRTAMSTGGYVGWTVPEFCMPSIASDTNNARRIAWFKDQLTKIKAGLPAYGIYGAVAVQWFDSAGIVGAAEKLVGTQEIAAWSAEVAKNPAT